MRPEDIFEHVDVCRMLDADEQRRAERVHREQQVQYEAMLLRAPALAVNVSRKWLSARYQGGRHG